MEITAQTKPKSILDYEFVLARVDTLGIWNFYPTMADAEAAAPVINAKEGESYRPMAYADYKAKEREAWLRDPATQITEEKFMEMLEVLPPMKWESHGNFESFLMSEFTSGVYTQQYARRGDTYWTKTVDAFDRSTWIPEVDQCAEAVR